MNRLLAINALVLIEFATAQMTSCDPEFFVGEIGVLGFCPSGYTETSNGECCAENHIQYGACADRLNTQGLNECPGLMEYCNNSMYQEVMIRNCARTCGFCE